MENGYWGHNSTFSEQQTRVPLILYYPGNKPSQHSNISSHLDLPATVLNILGIKADSSLYSFGNDLSAANYKRDYAIISDWHGNALISPEYKLILSTKGRKHGNRISTINDKPLAKLPLQANTQLADFLSTLARFNR